MQSETEKEDSNTKFNQILPLPHSSPFSPPPLPSNKMLISGNDVCLFPHKKNSVAGKLQEEHEIAL